MKAWAAARAFGLGWLVFRAWYAFKRRSGLMRWRWPAFPWEAAPLRRWLRDPGLADAPAYRAYRVSGAPRFFFAPVDRARYAPLLCAWDRAGCPITDADGIASGRWRYFGHAAFDIGFPPAWHRNPVTGHEVPADRHWSRIDDFGWGDIKLIWEPSRFGSAFLLVRAYWRTGDERYPELFWRLVESWRAANPPQVGPNWKCGQETSLRVMAWCFGLYGFLASPATTPTRVTTLAEMMAVSGQRIESNLAYALSQHNNHGISEAVGLWTIGALFPEFRDAGRWRALGRQLLEGLGRELIYGDGSFAQHSLNYHRLMLHAYVWALRLGELLGQPFSVELRNRIAQAGALLYQLQDGTTGQAPLYGANDGTLSLPLTNVEFHDFRPVVQSVHRLVAGTRCLNPGPWDEELLWLFGPDALAAPLEAPARAGLRAADGGYYVLRSPHGFAFTRCGRFRHRPGHADLLHVDLWWGGQNVAVDAGTHSYDPPGPWRLGLERTAYHNTVTVDDRDQMERVSRFLWYPWACGRVRHVAAGGDGGVVYWEGEHDGYLRLRPPASHRRALVRLDDAWLVVDALDCAAERSYRLHWLLPDLPHEWDAATGQVTLRTAAGPYRLRLATLNGQGTCSLVRADGQSCRGWRARYYAECEPALSVALEVRARRAVFWTLCSAAACRVTTVEGGLALEAAAWRAVARVTASATGVEPLVRVAYEGRR